MKTKILTFVMLVIAVTFAPTGCEEKPKDLALPEEVTELPDEPAEELVPEVAKDLIPPKVSSVSPMGEDVGINSAVSVAFSEPMDAASVNKQTLTVAKDGAGLIEGSISYSGVTAIFDPTNDLEIESIYKVAVKTGVQDVAANRLAEEYSWQFRTGSAKDTTPPEITNVLPPRGAQGVDPEINIVLMFTEEMDPATINSDTFKVTDAKFKNEVQGVISYSDEAAKSNPHEMLKVGMTYTVTASSDMKDLAGNNLKEFVPFTFRTGDVVDKEAPYVTGSLPSNGDTDVATNTSLEVDFNEPMDSVTINTANITLVQTLNINITGTISYDGTMATFTPDAALSAQTEHRFQVSKDVTDLVGNEMENNVGIEFTTGNATETTAPFVSGSSPEPGDEDVSPSSNIIIVFSEPMNPDTITVDAFLLANISTHEIVPRTVTYDNLTATVIPNEQLKNENDYELHLNKSKVEDLAGNNMENHYNMQFKTGTAPDNTPPEYLSFDPPLEAPNVSPTTQITVVFSEKMNGLTILANGAFVLNKIPENTSVVGVVTYSENTLTFTPENALVENSGYSFVVNNVIVADLAGNHPTEELLGSFTTGVMLDVIPPTVESIEPTHEATQIPTDIGQMEFTFSEEMDPSTIQPSMFTVQSTASENFAEIQAVNYANITALVTFSGDFEPNTLYRVALNKQVKDLAGNQMDEHFNSEFTTGAEPE